jgi:parallel beta-helix repeat protein
MFLSAIVILISNASAATIIVCPSGCTYSSIQKAIDAASSGDTIEVQSGTYYEQVIVDKTLKLQGENRDTTIIDGLGNGDVVLITKNNTNFSGFKVVNSGINPSRPFIGVKLLSVSNCIVSYNNVSNNDHGIALWTNSGNNLIENNNAYYNNVGIVIADHSNKNTIRNNNVSFNFYHGINPYLDSNENTIIRNIVLNNGYYGITPDSAHDNIITENYVSGNAYGIYTYSYFSQSSGNLIYRNNIIGNINQAYDDSGLNFWNNSTVGNHWSNFDEPIEGCNDLNNNGICDSSFSIPISSIDHYPMVTWNIPLPPPSAPIAMTFIVTDNNTGKPLTNVNVLLESIFNGKTNEDGSVTFKLDLKYLVLKQGYNPAIGVVNAAEKILYVKLKPRK